MLSALGWGAYLLVPVVQGALAFAQAIIGSMRQSRAHAETGLGNGCGRFMGVGRLQPQFLF